jgi:Mechanosensitive ion channel
LAFVRHRWKFACSYSQTDAPCGRRYQLDRARRQSRFDHLRNCHCLGTVGINVSALVAGLGLTGFALGFALKDALSNMLAGVLILSYRPFRHGQRIEVSGYQGTFANIDFRYTTLQTEEKTILLPNANLFTNTMVVFHNNSRVTDNNRQPSSAASAEPLHDRG